MKKSIKVFLLLAVIAVVAGYFFQRRDGGSDRDSAPLKLFGNVDIRQVSLGFRTGGRIETMAFEEGDAVKKGEVLAVLDKTPLEDALALYRAQAGVAEANVAKLEAGTRPAEIDLARTIVEERQITLDGIAQALARQSKLTRSGAISQQSADDTRAQRDAAAKRLESAKKTLALAEEGPRAEDIAIVKAEREAARARVGLAERELEDTELKAPSDGVILTRVQEPGAIVAPGSTVYTLSLKSPVWVRTYVSGPNLGRIHPGMKVQVSTDSKPDKPYEGQVGFISPVAEFTPKSVETEDLRTDLVYRVRVIIKQPDEGLRQGMPVTLRFPDA